MFRKVRESAQTSLRDVGIEIRKAAKPGYKPLPVFSMAVYSLMAERGSSLRFIQVGANDGRFVDPLREFITSFNWSGVLIEPQPDVFVRLQQNYASHASRLKFENIAVSSGAESIHLFLPPLNSAEVWDKSVVSTRPEVIARQLGIPKASLREIIVPCESLSKICKRHDIEAIDVLQIDTEGHDLEVLKTIDLGAIDVALIQFEHGHLTRMECCEIGDHLAQNGYRIFWGGHEADSVAMKEGSIRALSM